MIMAKQTDTSLENIIQAFPSLFHERTKGKRYPYSKYADCFKAYMSVQCASIFPACTALQGTQQFIPLAGRMPICLYVCLLVFAFCPGFGFDDIQGPCLFFSPLPPPFCAFAYYFRDDAIPPPIGSFDEAEDCQDTHDAIDLDAFDVLDDVNFVETPVLNLSHLPILRSVE
jgi:hypothetical protein